MNKKASFDQRVWEMVAHIPYGMVATYGQIADLLSAYGHARQVGWALGRLKVNSNVLWHRIVNSKGRILNRLSREGSDWLQRELLIEEGVSVDEEFRIDIGKYLWEPKIEYSNY